MYVVHPLGVHVFYHNLNGFVLTEYTWTNDLGDGKVLPFIYLPGVVMHEFGHTAGLGHNPVNGGVMYPGEYAKTKPSGNDKKAMKANYAGH